MIVIVMVVVVVYTDGNLWGPAPLYQWALLSTRHRLKLTVKKLNK